MNNKTMPTAMAGLLMAALFVAAVPTASATNCNAGPGTSTDCAFICNGGNTGVSVGISDQSGEYVEASASCTNSDLGAQCQGMGECHDSDEPDGTQPSGPGDCTGYADDGEGVVTCNGGDDAAGGALHLLGSGGCDDVLFRLLGYTSLAVVYISEDPSKQQQSFSWNINWGCVTSPSLCEKAGGRLGCHINKNFQLKQGA